MTYFLLIHINKNTIQKKKKKKRKKYDRPLDLYVGI